MKALNVLQPLEQALLFHAVSLLYQILLIQDPQSAGLEGEDAEILGMS